MEDIQKLNIIDEEGKIMDEESRENVHRKGLLHREIHIWIYNKKKEVLLQKRSMTKDVYPGLLDASVGGHVDLNDDYDKTAVRELEEETGIKVNKNDLTFITKLRKKSYDTSTNMINNVITAVYVYEYDNRQEIILEEGKADSLEFWPLEKIFNISEKDREKFVPAILSEEYIDIFRKIERLIKG